MQWRHTVNAKILYMITTLFPAKLIGQHTWSSHSSVLYPLQLVTQLFCCPSKASITVVQATDDDSQNSPFAGLVTDVLMHLRKPAKP